MKMPQPKTLLWLSVLTAAVTIVLKLLAWYVTGSVGLLSDGMESFVNLAGAIFALMMVPLPHARLTTSTRTATTRPSIFRPALKGC